MSGVDSLACALQQSLKLDDNDFSTLEELIMDDICKNWIKIIKIGGTRKGMKGRAESYLCGHHIQERQKSGRCSVTNAYVYNTLHFYIKHGINIEIYAYEIEPVIVDVEVFGQIRKKCIKHLKLNVLRNIKSKLVDIPSLVTMLTQNTKTDFFIDILQSCLVPLL